MLSGCRARLLTRAVVIAEAGQSAVREQPVGVHDRPGCGRRLGERLQRRRARVGKDRQAQAPGSGAADLDRGTDQRLLSKPAAALKALLVAAEPELVDLDLALEQLALRRDHRAAQLLQDQPRRLIARESE